MKLNAYAHVRPSSPPIFLPAHIHACWHPVPNPKQYGAARSKAFSAPLQKLSRHRLKLTVVASAQSNDEEEADISAVEIPGTYASFSAELLLAMARLGHLERYREEIKMVYHPGGVVDLTRCGLLISNIFSPQLDHRPYFTLLEDLAATVALKTMQALGNGSAAAPAAAADDDNRARNLDGDGPVFSGLDVCNPHHVLTAIQAINDVLFAEEGLCINTADPHDPLNASLADVLTSKRGNQYSLAIIYLHVAHALGLPCVLVGSLEDTLVRVGNPYTCTSPAAGAAASFLVDLRTQGRVYSFCTAAGPLVSTNSTLDSLSSAGSSSHSSAAGLVTPAAPAPSTSSMDDDWSRALQEHLGRHPPPAAQEDSNMSLDEDSRSVFSEWVVDDADGSGTSLGGWAEVDGAAATDQATANSWKLLYGPAAAMKPDKGLNPSSSDSSSTEGVAMHLGADELGILQAQFEKNDQQAGSSDSTTSVVGSFDADAETSELPMTTSSSSDSSSSSSMPTAAVYFLSADELVRFGGLQPVSGRVLLQQLLGGVKLSLLMSGRLEELLLVLRFLRATDPFSLADLRDEALTLQQLGRPEEAVPLLREYLAVAPGAPDADMVGEVLLQALLTMEIARNRARRNN